MATVGRRIADSLLPVAGRVRPSTATALMRSILDVGIDGRGRFPGARAVAERARAAAAGDLVATSRDLVEEHLRLAGAQGFITGLGGLATLVVALPANISGLAILQARMVGGLAHLRGYDLSDSRVRTAVAACLLGEEAATLLVRTGALPSTPLAIATAPVPDPELDRRVAGEVAAALFARVGGKRVGVTVARRIPLLGGGVGAVADAVSTYQVARYAKRELPPRQLPRRPEPS